jgi:hypothetical protein
MVDKSSDLTYDAHMTNTDTGSASGPTPDRLTAYVYLDTCSGKKFVTDQKITTRTLHEYLGEVAIDPAALTNPQQALPTEPGHYADSDGQGWQLHNDDQWGQVGVHGAIGAADVQRYGPFRRLVVEREPVTRDQVNLAGGGALTVRQINHLHALANRAAQ